MSILAAIDRDPGIEKVIETADELATGLDEELIFLHVVSEGNQVDKARSEVEGILEDVLGSMEGVELRVAEAMSRRDVPSGRMADRILKTADDVDARYIVVGSRKQTPVGKVMLGSVAQLVLVNAKVPVVTVEQTE
ncbi:MAG: universal stress protein [Haloferacaceae archaeon]